LLLCAFLGQGMTVGTAPLDGGGGDTTRAAGKGHLHTGNTQYRRDHKVRIFKEYRSVCPLVGIGTLPSPLSPCSECAPPPRTGRGGGRGEGHTPLRVRGWLTPNSDDWRKSLALCLLCGRDAYSGLCLFIYVINSSIELVRQSL
jgi:hypothetical protein